MMIIKKEGETNMFKRRLRNSKLQMVLNARFGNGATLRTD
jgi:hypothetical protein